MAAFNFPNSPSINDLHTENGVTFKWNGTVWKKVGASYTDTTNLNVTGIGTIAGNLNVGGVLTYEDVKNVDSVGIVTARQGLRITGGGLDVVGVSTFNNHVWVKDNQKLISGTNEDLSIYHLTADSDGYIKYQNENGHLKIGSGVGGNGGIQLWDRTYAKAYLTCDSDDAVKIYFNNSKKLETTNTGAKVTGTLDLTGDLYWDGDTDTNISNASTANWMRFKCGGVTALDLTDNADVKIHDNKKLKVGSGDDIQIFHNSGNSFSYFFCPQNNVFHEFNVGNSWTVQTTAGDDRIVCPGNGTDTSVQLFHNGSKKFWTKSDGAEVEGTFDADRVDCNGLFHIQYGSSTNTNYMSSMSNNNGIMHLFRGDGLFIGNNMNTSNQSGGPNNKKIHLNTDGTVNVVDDAKFSCGDGQDLQITHTGGQNIIRSYNGRINLLAAETRMEGANGSEMIAKFVENGAVELYYDNSKKLETTSGGAMIHDDLTLDGTLYGGHTIKTNFDGGGHFYHKNNVGSTLNFSSHFQTYRDSDEGGTTQTHVHYYHGGYAELLHQGNSSVRTLSNGTQFRNGGSVNGQITPNGLCFGSDTAAANALDDYEEGSFTPTALNGWGILNSSPDIATGKYVRIGAIVYIYFTFKEGSGNGSLNGNRLSFHNFPYQAEGQWPGSTNFSHPLQAYTNSVSSGGENIIGVPSSNGATIFSFIQKSSTGYTSFTGTNLGTSGQLFCAGTYRINGT